MGFLIMRGPVQWTLNLLDLGENEYVIRKLIGGPIIILLCLIIAKRLKFLPDGGFNNPRKRSYPLLLIPLIFPGFAFITGFNLNCLSDMGYFILSIIGTLIWGLMEEVTFRGAIIGYLRSRKVLKSPNGICIFSAFLFGIIHLTNLRDSELVGVLQQVIFAFFIGLLFGMLLFKVNSIWLLGIVHGILNIFSMRCEEVEAVAQDMVNKTVESDQSLIVALLTPLVLCLPILVVYMLLVRTIKPEDFRHGRSLHNQN